ncbi:hypothetical protein MXAZACID_13778 [Acidocella sp. MX-AZ02]|nr:hypothetical protein MXAZACID_13778 [Acidocella sp. MX-AZ02]
MIALLAKRLAHEVQRPPACRCRVVVMAGILQAKISGLQRFRGRAGTVEIGLGKIEPRFWALVCIEVEPVLAGLAQALPILGLAGSLHCRVIRGNFALERGAPARVAGKAKSQLLSVGAKAGENFIDILNDRRYRQWWRGCHITGRSCGILSHGGWGDQTNRQEDEAKKHIAGIRMHGLL